MALSTGEEIAIGVCVPLAVIIVAALGFLVWFKVIRVRTVAFGVSYVDDNGNIVTDEACPAPTETATSASPPPPVASSAGVAPVFAAPGTRPAAGDEQERRSLQQQSLAGQAQMMAMDSSPGTRFAPPGVM
jgi:hypothetical protein